MNRLSSFFLLAIAFASAALTPNVAKAQFITPEPGAYWNPLESGSGVQVDIQDSIMSVTYFGYDSAGRATFYLLAGRLDVLAGTLSGDIFAFSNGPCIGCPYNPPVASVLGRASIRFVNNAAAVLTLPTANGGTRSIPIERYSFAYGPNLETVSVGVWFTTVAITNDFPLSDIVRINTVLTDAAGTRTVVGTLFPGGEPVAGRAATIPGTTFNFLWVYRLTAANDAIYGMELALDGWRGFYATFPRGTSLPTRGILSFGARLAGRDTANQVIAGTSGAPDAKAVADRFNRAVKADGGANFVEFSPEARAAIDEVVQDLQAVLDAQSGVDR